MDENLQKEQFSNAYFRAVVATAGYNAEQPNHSSTWLFRDGAGEEFEIALPLNHAFRDFALRMSDALRTLEAVEERSQLEIFRDLLVTSADVIRVRLAAREFAEGSLPIEEGAQFFQKAKDMMLAAACAAAGPRAYYPSRKPVQAMEYLRKARLGQTEAGSFVLTIISRVAPSCRVATDSFSRPTILSSAR